MKIEREETEYVTVREGDGKTYHFTREMAVIKDLSLECPYCGANCGGAYYIWFVENEKRKTIIVERYRFHILLESGFEMENERILNYEKLPQFIAEYNEGREWADFRNVDGEVLDRARFREALAFIESRGPEDTELLSLLKEFLQYCEDRKLAIKIDEV